MIDWTAEKETALLAALCGLHDWTRQNMPWVEDWLSAWLAVSAILLLAGLAVWAQARDSRPW